MIHSRIIEHLAHLYGYENRLYVNYDKFTWISKTELFELCTKFNLKLSYKTVTKEQLIRIFVREQSFRNLLE
jgi:hypothetical protein